MFSKRLKDIVFALVRPSYWLSNYESHEHWDAVVNQLIDKDVDVKLCPRTGLTATVGEYEVWTGNFPYAFGYNRRGLELLPFRRTRKRLRDFIVKKTNKSIS